MSSASYQNISAAIVSSGVVTTHEAYVNSSLNVGPLASVLLNGTSGLTNQVLTSQGAGLSPTWTSVSVGAIPSNALPNLVKDCDLQLDISDLRASYNAGTIQVNNAAELTAALSTVTAFQEIRFRTSISSTTYTLPNVSFRINLNGYTWRLPTTSSQSLNNSATGKLLLIDNGIIEQDSSPSTLLTSLITMTNTSCVFYGLTVNFQESVFIFTESSLTNVELLVSNCMFVYQRELQGPNDSYTICQVGNLRSDKSRVYFTTNVFSGEAGIIDTTMKAVVEITGSYPTNGQITLTGNTFSAPHRVQSLFFSGDFYNSNTNDSNFSLFIDSNVFTNAGVRDGSLVIMEGTVPRILCNFNKIYLIGNIFQRVDTAKALLFININQSVAGSAEVIVYNNQVPATPADPAVQVLSVDGLIRGTTTIQAVFFRRYYTANSS